MVQVSGKTKLNHYHCVMLLLLIVVVDDVLL